MELSNAIIQGVAPTGQIMPVGLNADGSVRTAPSLNMLPIFSGSQTASSSDSGYNRLVTVQFAVPSTYRLTILAMTASIASTAAGGTAAPTRFYASCGSRVLIDFYVSIGANNNYVFTNFTPVDCANTAFTFSIGNVGNVNVLATVSLLVRTEDF